jgi:hypothetical protein
MVGRMDRLTAAADLHVSFQRKGQRSGAQVARGLDPIGDALNAGLAGED